MSCSTSTNASCPNAEGSSSNSSTSTTASGRYPRIRRTRRSSLIPKKIPKKPREKRIETVCLIPNGMIQRRFEAVIMTLTTRTKTHSWRPLPVDDTWDTSVVFLRSPGATFANEPDPRDDLRDAGRDAPRTAETLRRLCNCKMIVTPEVGWEGMGRETSASRRRRSLS